MSIIPPLNVVALSRVALGYGQGLLMFKALPGNEYIGEQPNLHYGPNARFQSKKVPSHLVDENKKDW